MKSILLATCVLAAIFTLAESKCNGWNLFEESCYNSGMLGEGGHEADLALDNNYNPGKRSNPTVEGRVLRSLLRKMHMVANKRCANLFDESCLNGGLPGANRDEEWLNNQSPGRK